MTVHLAQSAAHAPTTLATSDGHRIEVSQWQPPGGAAPGAVVQILHGLGEHLGRYERFAGACCDAGLAVVGHNHRGHGPDCEPGRLGQLGHFADRDGWNKVVDDAISVTRFAGRTWVDTPIVLLGHSMGSYIAQSVAAREAERFKALVLSASSFSPRLQLRAGRMLARIVIWRHGARRRSAFLNRLGLGNFNRRFAPNRTDFDWLSRDDVEVDRYIADPLCGFLLSNRFWHDLLGGLLEVTSPNTLRRIPADLPVLITGGEVDPVGGKTGMTRLAQAYERTGHGDVTLRIYPDGRHEMLNEINREEFTQDLLRWIERSIDR
jgi:alpha-beta hydrolase superfamily lysophospholipase